MTPPRCDPATDDEASFNECMDRRLDNRWTTTRATTRPRPRPPAGPGVLHSPPRGWLVALG
jgi:hypothetical protein